MKVIRDNVLIKPYPPDEKSTGGIIVSEAHRSVNNKMKVISVGTGTKQLPMEFKPGDTVIRIKDVGNEILIDGELHFIVKSNWLLAKLN